MNTFRDQLKKRLAKNKIEAILNELIEFLKSFQLKEKKDFNDLISQIHNISGTFNLIKEKINLGLFYNNEEIVETSKIRFAITSIINDLPDDFLYFYCTEYEKKLWTIATTKKTINSYKKYLNEFPHGKFEIEANKCLDELMIQNAKKTLPNTLTTYVQVNKPPIVIDLDEKTIEILEENELNDNQETIVKHEKRINNITEDWYNNLLPIEKMLFENSLKSATTITDKIQILQNCKVIDCSSKNIKDLNTLKNFKILEEIYCSNTSIISLEPISKLYALRIIDISGTKVVTLEPLANLLFLEKLYIIQTNIVSLQPLEKLPNLKEIYYTQNLIPQQEIDRFKSVKSECRLISEEQLKSFWSKHKIKILVSFVLIFLLVGGILFGPKTYNNYRYNQFMKANEILDKPYWIQKIPFDISSSDTFSVQYKECLENYIKAANYNKDSINLIKNKYNKIKDFVDTIAQKCKIKADNEQIKKMENIDFQKRHDDLMEAKNRLEKILNNN